MRRQIGFAASVALGVIVLGALPPSAARAVEPSAIAFADPAPLTATFGSDWHTELVVTLSTSEVVIPAPPAQGSVDVYVEGIAGAWATGLPIAHDGSVFVSQPLAQPLLPAGTHNVSAIFVPAADGFLETSQTSSPLELTITPLNVTGALEVVTDASTAFPVIRATLAGEYVDVTGGSPAGTWSLTATDSDNEVVFETDRPLDQGETRSLGVELSTKLEPGATYTISGRFTPAAELAGGVTVDAIREVEYTDGSTLASGSVVLPLWAIVVFGTLAVGLAVLAVILARRRGRRHGGPPRETEAPVREVTQSGPSARE